MFYLSLLLVLFLPGYFFTKFINSKFSFFTKLEEVVLAVGFSIFFSNILSVRIKTAKIEKMSIMKSVMAGKYEMTLNPEISEMAAKIRCSPMMKSLMFMGALSVDVAPLVSTLICW